VVCKYALCSTFSDIKITLKRDCAMIKKSDTFRLGIWLISLMLLLLSASVQAGDSWQNDTETASTVVESAHEIQVFHEEGTYALQGTDKMETSREEEIIPEEEPFEDEIELEEVEEVEEVSIPDPLEPWNRMMYHFNDRMYFWILKPVAKGYNAIAPEEVRISVRNFFHNITMPVRFVNAFLQGKIKSAGNELARFGINSTLGIAGLFDVAKKEFNLESHEEDLGQTLGSYGVREGFYIVWPFLGPSSLRDSIGSLGDGFLTPINYLNEAEVVIGIHSYKYVNNTSLQIGEYEDMKEAAIEPYTAIKDAYVQYRRDKIKK
jgi:phospholipid-binding lipoprotein MlaA